MAVDDTNELLKKVEEIKNKLEQVPGYDIGNMSGDLLARFVYPNFQKPGMSKDQAINECKKKLGVIKDPEVEKLPADLKKEVYESKQQLKDMYVGNIKELYGSANNIKSAALEVTDTIPTIASSISTLAVQVASMLAVWTTAAAALPTLKAGVSDIKNTIKGAKTTLDNIKNIGIEVSANIVKLGSSSELLKIFMPIITILETIMGLSNILSAFSKKADKAEKETTPETVELIYDLAEPLRYEKFISDKEEEYSVKISSIRDGKMQGYIHIKKGAGVNFIIGNYKYEYVDAYSSGSQTFSARYIKYPKNSSAPTNKYDSKYDAGFGGEDVKYTLPEPTNFLEIKGQKIFENGITVPFSKKDKNDKKYKAHKNDGSTEEINYSILFERLNKYYSENGWFVINGEAKTDVQFGTKALISVDSNGNCNYIYKPNGKGSEEDTYYTVAEPNPENINDPEIDKYNYTYEIKDDSTSLGIEFTNTKVKSITITHAGDLNKTIN